MARLSARSIDMIGSPVDIQRQEVMENGRRKPLASDIRFNDQASGFAMELEPLFW